MIFYNKAQFQIFIIILIGFYIMFLPAFLHALHAQVIINEIMYDPEGTDTGREWIELFNNSESEIDLATYKLFENNVNHKMSPVIEGDPISISAGGYVIVADNPEKFKIDFPNYNGVLIDSAFSLNNTGEPLSLVDSENNVIDYVEYSVDMGAKNSGNSLQRNDQDFWIEAKPTVGAKNKQITEIPQTGDSGSATSTSGSDSGGGSGSGSGTGANGSSTDNSNSTHSGQNNLSNYAEKIVLEIGAGRNRIVTINTPIEFKAEYNIDGKPKFMWSFGDGKQENGQKIEHIYHATGIYNVVLNALFEKSQATSRLKVTAVDVSVEILSISRGKHLDIMLKNLADKEVNLGGFVLKVGPKLFKISKDTIIDANSTIIVPFQYTEFELNPDFLPAEIHYPDGGLIYRETLSEELKQKLIEWLIQNPAQINNPV